jgi:hypothetical protein
LDGASGGATNKGTKEQRGRASDSISRCVEELAGDGVTPADGESLRRQRAAAGRAISLACERIHPELLAERDARRRREVDELEAARRRERDALESDVAEELGVEASVAIEIVRILVDEEHRDLEAVRTVAGRYLERALENVRASSERLAAYRRRRREEATDGQGQATALAEAAAEG